MIAMTVQQGLYVPFVYLLLLRLLFSSFFSDPLDDYYYSCIRLVWRVWSAHSRIGLAKATVCLYWPHSAKHSCSVNSVVKSLIKMLPRYTFSVRADLITRELERYEEEISLLFYRSPLNSLVTKLNQPWYVRLSTRTYDELDSSSFRASKASILAFR